MKILHIPLKKLIFSHAFSFGIFLVLFSFVFIAGGLVVANGQMMGPTDSHVVSFYHKGEETTVPTRAQTVKDFLDKIGVELYEADLVEPSLESPIDADNFRIQLFRARPVTITDGKKTVKTLTPHRSPQLIAQKAGFKVYPEDILTTETVSDFVNQNIFGEKLTIDRSIPVSMSLYGSPFAIYRTQADNVAGFLKERSIIPEEGATVSPSLSTEISENMIITISKYGKKIIAVEEEVPFETESTFDPTTIAGIISVSKAGVNGKKQVIYEIILQDDTEIGRNLIQEVIIEQPQKQLQVVGTKSTGILTKSKGVNQFTDSYGVVHRETYYDLPMSGVMNHCNGDGVYSVRSDGVKIDKDGYILIAASLISYPRCSVVETSLGLGKVYDTGGFATIYPYGIDIATDWSNYDGR